MLFDVLEFENAVPKKLMEFYVNKMELTADKRSFVSLYDALNSHNENTVRKLYSEYCYAGRTSMNLFKSQKLPVNFLNRHNVVNMLQHLLGTPDIFNREFKPTLSESPKINWIEEREDSILIQFVSNGKPRRIRNGYDINIVNSIEFEFAIIHFSVSNVIELRCSYNKHQKYLSQIKEYINSTLLKATPLDNFDWIPLTKVSEEEAVQISTILSAGLVEADHKDSGIYDKHRVTASPNVTDLRQEDAYIAEFSDKMLLSQVLVIPYKEETEYGVFETEIKLRINLKTGFQFLSKVNEPGIQFVMNAFLNVKFPSSSNVDLIS